jgi:hypothetical protein
MEVEVSGNSLDRSWYWLIALIADNSHVVHRDAAPHQIGRLSIIAITSYATPSRFRRV